MHAQCSFQPKTQDGRGALQGQFFCVAHSTPSLFVASLSPDLCSSAQGGMLGIPLSLCAMVQNWGHVVTSEEFT